MLNPAAIVFAPNEVAIYYETRVPGVKQTQAGQWRGPCPIHNGQDDNFAVEAQTGRWFCHSACGRGGDILTLEDALSGGTFGEIKAKVFDVVGRVMQGVTLGSRPRAEWTNVSELSWTFLCQRIQRYAAKSGLRHVCNYYYARPDGGLCFVKARFVNGTGRKSFLKYALTRKGGWSAPKGLGIQLLPYNVHLFGTAAEIHLCNGEKAADAGRKLGLVTTCVPDGEGKWDESFTSFFEGKRVLVYPDKDSKGEIHGGVVARALFGHASEIRLVELPGLPPMGDLYDWIEAGGTVNELGKILEAAPVVKAIPETKPSEDRQDNVHAKPESGPFRLTEDAVIYIDPDPEKEPMKICGRLEIAALTRDSKGVGWGRLLRWCDAENRLHEWPMPMPLLAGDGTEYRARLLDGGLMICPGRKARDLLTTYIQTARVETRALCVSRVGWQGDSFILPALTFGPEGAESIIFQTPHDSEHFLQEAGTLEEWRENVGRFCSGNSRLILAASCAFAGPLLTLTGAESGGIHFVGTSSTGKSTALQVGGSVLGGGGRSGFVQSWRATANGLETMADLHNDLTLFLDELSQMDAREAADAAYLLANGSGKSRMSRSIAARKKLSWCLMFVSAGETTLSDHAQTAGKRVRGGAEVRLLNIEADAGAGLGLFEEIHGAESPDAFARQLKDAARRFYGTPLRAYLDYLVRNRAAVEKAIKNFQANFLRQHVPAGASGEVSRAAQRLALVAVAGELATESGITGWKEGEVTKAAQTCLQAWIDHRGTTGSADAEAAIAQVRGFLEAHGSSRFQILRHPSRAGSSDNPDEQQVVRDRAGFRRRNPENYETEYLILQEVFKSEVCAGHDYKEVRKVLENRNYLVREGQHWTVKPRNLPEMPKGARVYCVTAAILGERE